MGSLGALPSGSLILYGENQLQFEWNAQAKCNKQACHTRVHVEINFACVCVWNGYTAVGSLSVSTSK